MPLVLKSAGAVNPECIVACADQMPQLKAALSGYLR
jgi:hypothetical protein